MKKSTNHNYLKSRNEVFEKATESIRSGAAADGNDTISKLGNVQIPIPIFDSKDRIVSWFVGITVKDRIVSFLQFDKNVNFMRYSTFLSNAGSIEGCPKAFTWLDSAYILKQARTKALPDNRLSAPFMTYDGNLSRIVWAVRSFDNHDNMKTIFVSGKYVYTKSKKSIS